MYVKNFIKEKLACGQPVIGIWAIINSPITFDIAAHAGLDFQILDMEHGVFDLPSLDNCIRACESMHCSPLVRVPGFQPNIIQNCLDLGTHGIIVPQVKNYQETNNVVRATRFSPAGTRGFNPFTRANYYDPTLPSAATKLNNEFALTAVIMENQSLFNDLDKILAIPELDLIYIGIYDLSCDLGLAGKVDHPKVVSHTIEAITSIRKAGKYVGLMIKNEHEMEKYVALGANVIVYGVDTHIYYSAIKKHTSIFKKQFVSKHLTIS